MIDATQLNRFRDVIARVRGRLRVVSVFRIPDAAVRGQSETTSPVELHLLNTAIRPISVNLSMTIAVLPNQEVIVNWRGSRQYTTNAMQVEAQL